MTGLIDHILNAPTWAVLWIVGGLVFAEDALFVGFVLPGETAAILGGVAASRGHVSVLTVVTVVVVAAIVGDSVGYEVGRRLGVSVLGMPVFDKHRGRVDDAQVFLARRGGSAVFLGRWVAFFRAVMPALAGAARMRYAKFLVFNATGGIVWGITVVLLGYLAGESYTKVEHIVGRAVAVLVAGIALIALAVWRLRKHRGQRAHASLASK